MQFLKYLILILGTWITLSGCQRSNSPQIENSIPDPLVLNLKLNKLHCPPTKNYQFANNTFYPRRDQEITCCLIDHIHKGSQKHIKYAKEILDQRKANGTHYNCLKSRKYLVYGEELFRHQFKILNQIEFFKCIPRIHGGYSCPAEPILEELIWSIREIKDPDKKVLDLYLKCENPIPINDKKCNCVHFKQLHLELSQLLKEDKLIFHEYHK